MATISDGFEVANANIGSPVWRLTQRYNKVLALRSRLELRGCRFRLRKRSGVYSMTVYVGLERGRQMLWHCEDADELQLLDLALSRFPLLWVRS